MRCARSTAAAYLRDFRLHRAHVLRTVTSDQLVDQVVLITQPDSDPAQHRQHVATTRELRLLLNAMPGLEEHERQQQEEIEAARLASETALARSRHYEAGQDGHVRYYGVANSDKCQPDCPTCNPELFEGDDPLPPIKSLADRAAVVQRFPDLWPNSRSYMAPNPDPDESAPIEPEPDQSALNPDESGQIWTNLDESGPQIQEFPVPHNESPKFPQNFHPPKPVGPEYPVSWENPTGYIPRNNVIAHTTYTPTGGRRTYRPPGR